MSALNSGITTELRREVTLGRFQDIAQEVEGLIRGWPTARPPHIINQALMRYLKTASNSNAGLWAAYPQFEGRRGGAVCLLLTWLPMVAIVTSSPKRR